jgi:hypothetical protein
MPYNFSITLRPWGTDPNKGQVSIDPVARYGYWERKDGSEGGGLWFDTVPGLYRPGDKPALELVDYDGAFALPRAVYAALRDAGYADESFDPDSEV